MLERFAFVVLCGVVAACSGSNEPNPGFDSGQANDAGGTDSGTNDAGSTADSGAGDPDAGDAGASSCTIAGVGYAPQTLNPQNGCQVCDPTQSTSAWSNAPDGTACGVSTQVCTGGTCGCPTNTQWCGSACVNTATDSANCGQCNHACVGLTTCFASNCEVVPPPMPTPRTSLAVAGGNDGRIYAIGGFDAHSTIYNTLEIYSPATNTWSTGAPMPTARNGFAAATGPDGHIYAVGGESGFVTPPLQTLEIYDPASDTWDAGAPMPTGREGLGAALGADGRIYAIGGDDNMPGDPAYATVEAYTPATNTWAAVASMPTARTFLAAAAAGDGRIYAMGGTTGLGAMATVEAFDPIAGTWATVPVLPQPAVNFAAAATGGVLFAIGGSGLNPSSTVQSFTPATNTWSTLVPSLLTARGYLGAAVGGDGRIYAVGGYDNTAALSTVEAYLPGSAIGWVP
jgi:N-acetylneuraminic acid mutarotase